MNLVYCLSPRGDRWMPIMPNPSELIDKTKPNVLVVELWIIRELGFTPYRCWLPLSVTRSIAKLLKKPPMVQEEKPRRHGLLTGKHDVIRDMHKRGMSVSALADMYSVSRTAIQKVIREKTKVDKTSLM